MNQIHRIGLGVAGVAAILTVAGAMVVDGYVTANHDVAQATASQAAPTDIPTVEPTASPTSSDPLTIYVKPLPTQPVTHVTKPATVRPVRPVTAPPVTLPPEPVVTPPTIHVIVPTPGGDDNGGTDN
ncbi:MAG TPA: hypothetical protein VF344_07725 [Candidatus Limnocylindrales bacterium]